MKFHARHPFRMSPPELNFVLANAANYSENMLTRRTTTERRAKTPGRRNHLFLRTPAAMQSPDATIRQANTCNGRILASSLLAIGRASSTQVSKNNPRPAQPTEVHAALWVSGFICSTQGCDRPLQVIRGSALQSACCPSRT